MDVPQELEQGKEVAGGQSGAGGSFCLIATAYLLDCILQ
jgi:hypothetical protein